MTKNEYNILFFGIWVIGHWILFAICDLIFVIFLYKHSGSGIYYIKYL